MARLKILWQDPRLVAVYKPAGWLVHRTGLDAGETRFVLQTLREQLGGRWLFPVHRLDKGTCGVLLFALDPDAARTMTMAFAGQRVGKRYLALVRGWAPREAEVDHALRPEDAGPDAQPQPARTRFRRLARTEIGESFDPRFPGTRASLVEAIPETGRRHQVRRHLKHLSHPIIGDATHGKGPLNRWWAPRLGTARLWLHARSIEFPHLAGGGALRIDSGLDPEVIEHVRLDPEASLPRAGEAPERREDETEDLSRWTSVLARLPWAFD